MFLCFFFVLFYGFKFFFELKYDYFMIIVCYFFVLFFAFLVLLVLFVFVQCFCFNGFVVCFLDSSRLWIPKPCKTLENL